MTTPTTNFGWLKPDPDEPVSLSVYNQWLDDFDADMKAKEVERAIEIPYVAEFGLYPGTGYVAGDDQIASSAGTSDLNQSLKWVNHWEPYYSNRGGFEIDSIESRFKFTDTGIYRFTPYWGVFNTTGITGQIRCLLYNVTQATGLNHTQIWTRAQSYVGTTTWSAVQYLDVQSSGGSINVNDILTFRLNNEATDSAAMTLRIGTTDDWVRPRIQVEWVRPL